MITFKHIIHLCHSCFENNYFIVSPHYQCCYQFCYKYKYYMWKDPKLQKLSKREVRLFLKNFFLPADPQRYESAVKDIQSLQDAFKWNGYKNEEDKQQFIHKLKEVVNSVQLTPQGEEIIEIEQPFQKANKSQEILNPYSHPSFDESIKLLLQKKEDTKQEQFKGFKQNCRIINKTIENQDFKKWAGKEKEEAAKMDVEYPIQEKPEEDLKHMDIEFDQEGQSNQDKCMQRLAQQLSEKRIQSKNQLLGQIKQHLQKVCLENAYTIIIAFLQCICSKPQGIMLNEVEKKLKSTGHLNSCLKSYFQKVKDGIEKVRLKGHDGSLILYRALEILLPIDCFELQERCKKYSFKDADIRLIILGADKSGKTTYVQTNLQYTHQICKQANSKEFSLFIQEQVPNNLATAHGPQKVTIQMCQFSAKINNVKLNFVDGPGFWQSNGAQMDIASKVALEKVYKSSKNLYYVLILNPHELNNSQIKQTAKRITQRFQYQTLPQLHSFLLIIFNYKIGKSIPNDLEERIRQLKLEEKSYKKQIALEFISQSWRKNDHHYKPLQKVSVERVRNLVSRIKFNTKKLMKYEFEYTTLRTINRCCQVLLRNISAHLKKNEIHNVRFYYSIIYIFSGLIPDYIQKTKMKADLMLQKKSGQPYDKMISKFNSMIRQVKKEDNWFKEVQLAFDQLITFNQLSQINHKIKSQKEVKENLNDFATKLKEKIKEEIDNEKIQVLCQFISEFYEVFVNYLPEFFEQIEKKCFNSIKILQQQLEGSFGKQQSLKFNQYMDKYQNMLAFYTNFRKRNHFNYIEAILTQQQLVSHYLKKIEKIETQILQKKEIAIDSLTNESICTQQSINTLQKLLVKFKQFSKISCLHLIERLIALEEGLRVAFSSKFSEIYIKFEGFFGDYSQEKRNSLQLMIAKIKQAQQITNFPQLQKQIHLFNIKIANLIHNIEEQGRNKVQDLRLYLKENISYKKEGSECLNLKIYNLNYLQKAFDIHNNDKFKNQYALLVRSMQQLWLKIQQHLGLETCNYTEPLRLLKFSSVISNAAVQFKQKHNILDEKLTKKLSQDIKSFEEKVSKMKIENMESLSRNLNITQLKLFQSYVINIFNAFRNNSHLNKPSHIHDIDDDESQETHLSFEIQFKNSYHIICCFFLEVQSIINKNEIMMFPSSLSQISQFTNSNYLSAQVSEYIDILIYVYSVISNFAFNYKILDQYLRSAFDSQEIRIDVSQIERHIKDVFQKKLKETKERSLMIIQNANIVFLKNLLKQSKAWERLQRTILQDTQRLEVPNLVKSMELTLQSLEGRHTDEIKQALNSDYRMIDIQRFIELYFELRNASDQKSKSSQNFRIMKSHLSTYIKKINEFLDINYDSQMEFKLIQINFISRFKDLIKFYRQFKDKLSRIAGKVASEEEIINEIIKILVFMLGEIKKNFQQAQDKAKQEIRLRNKTRANQFIDRMNKLARLIKEVQTLGLGTSQSYYSAIGTLQASILSQAKKEQEILSKGFIERSDLPFIQSLIQTEHRIPILKNLRDYLDKQIQKLNQISWEYREKEIRDFENAILALSTREKDNFELSIKISELKKTLRLQQQKFIEDIMKLNMSIQSERKKIISGFNSLKRNQDKSLILEKITFFLKNVAWDTIGNRQIKVQDKITIYQRQVEIIYELVMHAHQSIRNIFKQIEEDYLQALLQALCQNTQTFINLLQLQRKISQRPASFNDNLKAIFLIMTYLQKKAQILFRKQQIEKINENFANFVSRVILFEKYCPVRYYHRQTDKTKRFDLLRKIMSKIVLYEELLEFALRYEQNSYGMECEDYNMVEEQMLMMNVRKQINKRHENEKYVFFQLSSKIESFKSSVRSKIDAAMQILKKFQFSFDQSTRSDIDALVEEKVRLLQANLHELQGMTVVSQLYPTLQLVGTEKLNEIGSQLKKRLNIFIEKNINELYNYIKDLDGQMPKDFYYMFVLVQNIAQKQVTYPQIETTGNKKVQMVTNDCLMVQFSNLKNQLVAKIFQQNQKISSFVEMDLPEKQAKIKYLTNQKQRELNQSEQQKKERLQEVKRKNQGKRSEIIEDLIQEESNQLDVQISNKRMFFEEKIQAAKQEKDKMIQDLLHDLCIALIKLMKLQLALQNFLNWQEDIKNIFVQTLHKIQKLKMIKAFSNQLKSFDCDQIVHSIKSTCNIFEFETQQEFKKKTKDQGIDYVLQLLQTKHKINSSDQNPMQIHKQLNLREIREKYNYIMYVYRDLLDSNQSSELMKENLSSANDLRYLATILAVWSNLMTIRGDDNQIICRPEPHPVQIVTLILLTMKNEISQKLQSKLAQVKTGEGKSIILATLAIFYARLEYKVKVVCYSQYLSQRDYKAFKRLFQFFNVTDKIFYGTFNDVCQKFLTNQNNNIRDTVKKYFTEESSPLKMSLLNRATDFIGRLSEKIVEAGISLSNFFENNEDQSSKQIILVDEVDVMFCREYLGQIFRPVVKFDEPEFKRLLVYVYDFWVRYQKITPKDIFDSQPYNICINKYKKLARILEFQVNGMIQALTSIQEHHYQVHEKEIKYQDKDKLSSNLHYGYMTIFANCKEFAEDKISASNYQKNLFIPIKIGQLSYSQLPGQSIIQGSSGTVASLSASKDIILQKYNISQDKVYILPGIYGRQNVIVPVLHLERQQTFYKMVAWIIFTEYEKSRPVVACFQNHQELKNFEKSQQFKALNIKPSYLHELQSHIMRDRAIKGAGSKTVTLMTSEFSRGTDIMVIDRTAIKNGGLALIMAYIPKSQSQFEQFKGRTGRQGNNGSIDIVFNSHEFVKILDKHKLIKQIKVAQSPEEIMDNFYDLWRKLDESEMKEKLVQLQLAKEKHLKFINIMKNMGKADKQHEFVKYIQELNIYGPLKKKLFRVLLGIDGTLSMKIIFEQLRATLKTIVDRIQQIKRTLKVDNTFELKIAVYRNYNTGSSILQHTKWQRTTEELAHFLSNVNVLGGQGNEAIEILYRYINKADEFDMLILMGDAPPNTTEEISLKKKYMKKKETNVIWQAFQKNPLYNSQFFDVQSSEAELEKFRKDFIIHGLAIKTSSSISSQSCNKRFEEYIKVLCKQFNGQSKSLDFSNQQAKEQLIKFITTKIAKLITDFQEIDRIYMENFQNEDQNRRAYLLM